MALRSKQKLWHKIAFSWVTLTLLLLMSLLLMQGVWEMYHKNTLAKSRAKKALSDLQKVEAREKSLLKNLEHIKTSEGIEEELRRKFDVARMGEQLLIIIDKEVEPDIPQGETSWVNRLWRKFIK